jgi:hypothetical protein
MDSSPSPPQLPEPNSRDKNGSEGESYEEEGKRFQGVYVLLRPKRG